MRVMVLVPADKNSEAGVMPSQDLISKMMKFASEGRRDARRKRTDAHIEGEAREIFQCPAHGHRRPICGIQGAHRRLD